MPFDDAMNVMLPPQNGTHAHITVSGSPPTPNVYGQVRQSGVHGGVDFNYVGGQGSPLNQSQPVVYSPVNGQVLPNTANGEALGMVRIRGEDGHVHEILHLHSRSVDVGQNVAVGQPIGTMGGRGPNGPTHYQRHVHYQIRNPAGAAVDPQLWWVPHVP